MEQEYIPGHIQDEKKRNEEFLKAVKKLPAGIKYKIIAIEG